jgi:transcriptional regulator with PAS, ATPase and Fis domain
MAQPVRLLIRGILPRRAAVSGAGATEGFRMIEHAWLNEFPGAVTVCDERGTIIEMNEKAVSTFEKDGGRALIGTDLRACHPEPARSKVDALFTTRRPNVYTIRKQGIRKLIYQSPWYRDGEFAGIVELSLEIPGEIPEFIRV